MAYYNTSLVDSALHLGEYIVAVDALMGGLVFSMILYGVGVVLMLSMAARGYALSEILLANGFILTLGAMILNVAGLVGYNLLILPLLLLLAGILMRIFRT